MQRMHAFGAGGRWGALAMLLLAGAGCDRNQGAFPAGFTPEGVASSTTFIALGVDSAAVHPDGSVGAAAYVTVLDNSITDSFVLYRQLDGESGFQPILTFDLPFGQTFNSSYRTFNAVDYDVQANRGARYMARGVVNGGESKLSPLSATAYLPAAPIDALVPALFAMLYPIVDPVTEEPASTDSVPTLQWESVPGAVRYLAQVVRSDGKFFLAALTPSDGSTSYTLQSKAGLVLHELILTRATYFWIVQAYDGNGLQVGSTYGFQVFVVDQPEP